MHPAPAPAPAAFPPLDVLSPTGRRLVLPRDFEGALNFVVATSGPAGRVLADAWFAAARGLVASHRDLRVIDLSSCAPGTGPLASWWALVVRGGLPDPVASAHVRALFADAEPLRRLLPGLADAGVHVVLVTRAGRVLWEAAGPVTGAAREGLAGALAHPVA